MKFIAAAGRIAGIIAGVLLVIMSLMTVLDICGRFFFSRPITGATELTEYMIAIIAFFAIAWAAVAKRHVKVDLVVSHFSSRVQVILDVITSIAGIIICCIIAWRLAMEGLDLQELKMASRNLSLFKYPFYYVASLGCVLLTIVLVGNLVQRLMKMRESRS